MPVTNMAEKPDQLRIYCLPCQLHPAFDHSFSLVALCLEDQFEQDIAGVDCVQAVWVSVHGK